MKYRVQTRNEPVLIRESCSSVFIRLDCAGLAHTNVQCILMSTGRINTTNRLQSLLLLKPQVGVSDGGGDGSSVDDGLADARKADLNGKL